MEKSLVVTGSLYITDTEMLTQISQTAPLQFWQLNPLDNKSPT